MESIMAVYARRFETQQEASLQFEAFDAWSNEHASECTSAWLTEVVAEPPFWCVIVADDSDDSTTLRFPWEGTSYVLAKEQALGWASRRVETVVATFLDGKRGRVAERYRFGRAVAPRMQADGTFTTPHQDSRNN
jgi:hypothetical protein